MLIDHRGSNETITRAEIEYALNWYINRLLGPRLSARCRARIVHKTYFGEDEDTKAVARAFFVNNHKHPRRFVIELSDKLKKAPLLRALAHEAVHVKQYAKGELWDNEEGFTCFKKRTYKAKDFKKYRERPWEKEAYRVERSLYAAYKRHKEKEKLF